MNKLLIKLKIKVKLIKKFQNKIKIIYMKKQNKLKINCRI